MRSIQEQSADFPACATTGLSSAEVLRSQGTFGLNRLTPLARESSWRQFAAKFDDPIIRILLAACLLKVVVDLFAASAVAGLAGLGACFAIAIAYAFGRVRPILPSTAFLLAAGLAALSVALEKPSFEGLAVMVAVLLATGVAYFSEWRSAREFELLDARRESHRVKAFRDGTLKSLPMEQVVVGDLLELEMGDELPADCRIVSADGLSINQSLLTGESEPVAKVGCRPGDTTEGPDHPGCAYRGTQVIDGRGRATVTDVGDMTMIGQIARQLSGADPDGDGESPRARVHRKLAAQRQPTPLQEKLSHLAELISRIGYAAALAIFAAMLVRGYFVGEWLFSTAVPDLRQSLAALLDYAVYTVVVIVVAVPEGLPMSVTVSLALAMRKMARANCHVRQLVACETIGSASVICSDKTGTITLNRMRVDHVGQPEGNGNWLKLNAAINSTAHVEVREGNPTVLGNSTEGALLLWMKEYGFDYAALRAEHPPLCQLHFTSDRKEMRTVARIGSETVLLVKGAAELVLARCRKVARDGGTVGEMAESDRSKILGELAAAGHRAMRTLAFAHAVAHTSPDGEDFARNLASGDIADLVFDGYAALRDPIRPDAHAALHACRTAGIAVKMVTGDNAETATAIGQEIGLLDDPDSLVMTSDEFAALGNEDLKAKLPQLRILARAKPLDKLRLVRLLQEQRHVVAVTGDGTNDAPALKQADIGLAMGSGTAVAKEAGRIVLLDDSFATIVRAVHWGRALAENIQRFLLFQLTINVSALAIALLGPFLGVKPPFTVLQLLWINVIMDTFAAIALCSEPPRHGLLLREPVARGAAILTRALRRRIAATAAFCTVGMLGLLMGMKHAGWFFDPADEPAKAFAEFTRRQVAIFFTAYVFLQVWNLLNCRSLDAGESGLRRLRHNPVLLAVAGVTIAGQVAIIQFGGPAFDAAPLGIGEWALLALSTATILIFGEALRRKTG